MKHTILGLAAMLTVTMTTMASAQIFSPITNRCVVAGPFGPEFFFVTNPGPAGAPCTFWNAFTGWRYGIFG